MHPLIAAYLRREKIRREAEPTKGPSSPYYPMYLRLCKEADDWFHELLEREGLKFI